MKDYSRLTRRRRVNLEERIMVAASIAAHAMVAALQEGEALLSVPRQTLSFDNQPVGGDDGSWSPTQPLVREAPQTAEKLAENYTQSLVGCAYETLRNGKDDSALPFSVKPFKPLYDRAITRACNYLSSKQRIPFEEARNDLEDEIAERYVTAIRTLTEAAWNFEENWPAHLKSVDKTVLSSPSKQLRQELRAAGAKCVGLSPMFLLGSWIAPDVAAQLKEAESYSDASLEKDLYLEFQPLTR